MGLEERRRIRELQEVTLPGRVREVGIHSDNAIRDVLMAKL